MHDHFQKLNLPAAGRRDAENLSEGSSIMRLAQSLRNLALGVAGAAFVATGANAAYAAPSVSAHSASQGTYSSESSSSRSQAWHLVGVNAHLQRSINTSSARSGQKVVAKLNEAVTTSSGIRLDRGTLLMGRVAHVSDSSHRGPSSLSIVFTSAKLHNGRVIPVKATVLSAARGSAYGWEDSSNPLGPAPHHVSPKENVQQKPGLLTDTAMRSAVGNHNSATFVRKNGNIKLLAGTYLQLAIAAHGSDGMHNGAMKSDQQGG